MTMIGQAWHLAKKDAAQFRWWLLGYVLLAVAATLTSTQIVENDWSGLTAMFVPALWLLGGVIAALLVQADAPANARAFWASQPMQARAVLLGKLTLAVVVLIMPPLIGEIISLRYFGVTGEEFGSLMARAVWGYAGWLLVAMLVAALTGRFASFVATIIAVPIAFVIIGITINASPWHVGIEWMPRALLQLVATAGAAALLTMVYRRRSAARPLQGAGAMVLAASLLAITRPAARAERPSLESVGAPGVELDIASFDAERLVRDRELFVDFKATGMRAPYRYAVLTDSAAATWSDSATTPLWVPLFMSDVPRLFGGPAATTDMGSVLVQLPRNSRDTLRDGSITSFRVFGAVETLTGERVLRLDPGGVAEHRDGDMRLRISGGTADRADVSLQMTTVQMTTVYRTGVDVRDIFAVRRRYTAHLVWPARTDTVELALGNVSDEERMLVLPGASVHRISMRRNSDRRPARDSLPAPLAEASLELMRWTPVARRPFVVTRALP